MHFIVHTHPDTRHPTLWPNQTSLKQKANIRSYNSVSSALNKRYNITLDLTASYKIMKTASGNIKSIFNRKELDSLSVLKSPAA